jgi:hypothetical protein
VKDSVKDSDITVSQLDSSGISNMPTTKKTPAEKRSDLAPSGGARTGLSVADLKQSFLDHLFSAKGDRKPEDR